MPKTYRKSEIQSVIFDKHKWGIPYAYSWLIDHNLRPIKPPHILKHTFRYRINNPKKYHSFITKRTSDGINIIIGYK